MTHESDPLEQELAALRPAEPSAKLAERIGKHLAEERKPALKQAAGGRRVLAAFWLPSAGVLVLLLACAIWWRSQTDATAIGTPIDLPQPTLATALDDRLPSVWTFRPALDSPGALDQLLDQHAARPNAGSDPVQTRGFVPLTMNLNSRQGEP